MTVLYNTISTPQPHGSQLLSVWWPNPHIWLVFSASPHTDSQSAECETLVGRTRDELRWCREEHILIFCIYFPGVSEKHTYWTQDFMDVITLLFQYIHLYKKNWLIFKKQVNNSTSGIEYGSNFEGSTLILPWSRTFFTNSYHFKWNPLIILFFNNHLIIFYNFLWHNYIGHVSVSEHFHFGCFSGCIEFYS